MPEQYQPKYKWQETWPGEGKQDFVGYDGKEIVGRIQVDQTTSGKENQWRWNGGFASWIRRRIMPQQGWAQTAREASRMAEEHYDNADRASRAGRMTGTAATDKFFSSILEVCAAYYQISMQRIRPNPISPKHYEALGTNMIGKFEELVLLALIKAGPSSQAAKVYDVFEKTQEKMPQFAAMYTALDRMVNKGLITETADTSGPKQKRLFTISGAGRMAYNEAVNATRKMEAYVPAVGVSHV